jgi:ATP-binding cassette subfamily B protein
MLSQNVYITIGVVVLTPVSFFVASFIAKRSYNMFTMQSLTRSDQVSMINEIIPNEQVIQAYSYEERAIEKFDEINNKLSDYSLKATFYSSITNPATRFVNNLVYAAVGITGVIFVTKGFITVGVLSSFLSYANQYTKPFNDISNVITELTNALACAKRVFDFLELPEIEDIAGEEDADFENSFDGTLALKDVKFGYNENQIIIEDVDMDLRPGHKCAIVGPTGCGKTTIINLIMRFYEPMTGIITLGGKNIKEMSFREVREHIGMVLQDTYLLSGTIAENIAYGKPDATMEEIVEAAKACYADSFIKRMPEGYETYISETGTNLSAGQKQLICIARVMLKKPEVLILDEATSNIDTLTEIKVVKAFDKLMEGRTSLIVAHRLSTIKNADCIFVLDKGRVIEEGNHEELLEKKGFYEKLYKTQFAS